MKRLWLEKPGKAGTRVWVPGAVFDDEADIRKAIPVLSRYLRLDDRGVLLEGEQEITLKLESEADSPPPGVPANG